MSDCDVSVHGDDDQVQDAGGAGPHVHRQPDEAEVATKDPCVQDLVDSGERKDQDTQEEISQGERDDDGVGWA